MKNILVVGGTPSFLKDLHDGFDHYPDEFRLFVADEEQKGFLTLQTVPIDLVVAAAHLPQMDGMEFLSALRRVNASVPAVIIGREDSRFPSDELLRMGVVQALSEPVSGQRLIGYVREYLSGKTQQGRLQGISLINFLQVIEMEKKTYLLDVISPSGEQGLFYFQDGEPYDALCGEMKGVEAALEMIGWDNVEIHFRTLPTRKILKRIDQSLMSLLMNATLMKDEKAGIPAGEVTDWSDLSLGLDSELIEPPIFVDRESSVLDEGIDDESVRNVGIPGGRGEEEDGARKIDRALQELFRLRGVRASIFLNREGGIVTEVGSWPGSDLTEFGNSVNLVHGGAEEMHRELRLAALQNLTLESDDALIMCTPAGDHLLTVLASDSRMLGVLRQKIVKLAREI